VLGPTPPLDLDREARAQALCHELIVAGLVRAAHDVSGGGLAVALAEMCMAGEKGAELDLTHIGKISTPRADAALFGEGATRMLLEIRPEDQGMMEDVVARRFWGVPYDVIGRVTAEPVLAFRLRTLTVPERAQATLGDMVELAVPLADLREQWEGVLECAMK
jgi:phosphoribosylformylglycinamidine synthase